MEKKAVIATILAAFPAILIAASLAALILTGCAAKVNFPDNPAQIYTTAEDYYNRGKYTKAVELLDHLTLNHAGSQFADDAQLLIAMSYFKDKKYSSAAAEFRRLLTSFPESEHVENAQYMIAESYWEMSPRAELDQDFTETALDLYNDFIEFYPESQYADSALVGVQKCLDKLALKLYKSTELYYKMKDYESVILYADRLVTDYPETASVPGAFLLQGKALIETNKKKDGLVILEQLVAGFPDNEAASEARNILEASGN